MDWFNKYIQIAESWNLSFPLLAGIMVFFGQLGVMGAQKLKTPSIVGFLVIGILLGSSFFDLINHKAIEALSVLSTIALSFVAVELGLELSLGTFKRLGLGSIILIVCESLFTFFAIGIGMYYVSGSVAMGLAAGAVGCASAPSGPVAVIREYKARGKLTSTIFAVVGFDDAVGIIIFSFASTIASSILEHKAGHMAGTHSLIHMFTEPLRDILLAALAGGLGSLIFRFVTRKINDSATLFIWLFAILMLIHGFAKMFDFSLILADMILGIIIVNTMSNTIVEKLTRVLSYYMPLIFALFFVYAGAQLDIKILPTIGIAGLVFTVCRVLGKFLGSYLGALMGKLDKDIRDYIWMGLLSQIGVGLGLSMIMVDHFSKISEEAKGISLEILSIITATSLIFELLGPGLTKIALIKTKEITNPNPSSFDEDDE